MSRLLIGTERPQEIWLGNSEITQLYMGTELIWERIPDIWEPMILEVGAAVGVEWVGGLYNNPSDVPYRATCSNTTGVNYRINFSSTSTARYYGNCWSTKDTIRIPRTATTLNVRLNKNSSYYQGSYRIGLLPVNASSWADTSHGGILTSTATVPSGTTAAYPTLTIPESMRGSSEYRIVLSFWGKSDTQKDIIFKRVWFS